MQIQELNWLLDTLGAWPLAGKWLLLSVLSAAQLFRRLRVDEGFAAYATARQLPQQLIWTVVTLLIFPVGPFLQFAYHRDMPTARKSRNHW